MEESGGGGVWLGKEEDGGCSSGEGMVGSGFADELMEGPVEKIRLSRKQKREARRAFGLERAKDKVASKLP